MDHPEPDLTFLLPRGMYDQLIHTVPASLPAHVTAVVCLLPANADEANLAASAQGLDCLRLAREHPPDVPLALKCTAQAASMMRQARSVRALLLCVQAVREKREADNASLDKAAWKVALIMAAPDQATAPVLAVHRDLEAPGKVRWSIQAVPPALEDSYVAIAATALAPIKDDEASAFRQIDQYIALPSSGKRVQKEYY